MKRIILMLITPLFLIYGETIAELNKKGISALHKKDYKKAEEYFKKSISLSPLDAKANYNLACTYALMESECETAEADTLGLLEKAVAGDKYYKAKMLRDPDLKVLRNNVRFYQIAGLTNKQILTKITWYGPKPGVANIDKLVFLENGTFKYSIFNASGEANPGYLEYNGNYIWTGEDIQIQLIGDSPFDHGKRKLKVKMKDNTIKIEGLDHDLTDFEDRCSA
jgi:tetratricopeptide (TPR) repeat protein